VISAVRKQIEMDHAKAALEVEIRKEARREDPKAAPRVDLRVVEER
jgi:hypothetical protein